MTTFLVASSAALARHLASPSYAPIAPHVVECATHEAALAAIEANHPQVLLIDDHFGGPHAGYTFVRELQQHGARRTMQVFLVTSERLGASELANLAQAQCDAVLVAPLSPEELYDAIAVALRLPRPGTEAYAMTVSQAGAAVPATVSNLSTDGARIITGVPLHEGDEVVVTVAPLGHAGVAIAARVLWAQRHDQQTVAGANFPNLTPEARGLISRLTQWQIVREGDRTRVVLRGDFTEATTFDSLVPQMVGRVMFDLAEVTYVNSLGVRAWCEFLRAARIVGYEFVACSVPFVVQAAMVRDALGRGTVTSFFAPYHCAACDYQDERLLQTALILAANLEPPTFVCPACRGALQFDDLPERYLAFLVDDDE